MSTTTHSQKTFFDGIWSTVYLGETDFDLIWGEYARKTFEADFSVDTISLLRKGEKRWEIVN